MRFIGTVNRTENYFRTLRQGALLIFFSLAPSLSGGEDEQLPKTIFGDPIRPLGDVDQQAAFFREILPTSLTSLVIGERAPEYHISQKPIRKWLKVAIDDHYLSESAFAQIVVDKIHSVEFGFGRIEKTESARKIFDGFVSVLGQPDVVAAGFRPAESRTYALRWKRKNSTITLRSSIILATEPWLTIHGSVYAPELPDHAEKELIQLRGARLRSHYANWLKRSWTPAEDTPQNATNESEEKAR